ncbi:MAG TPA: peptidoglycan bridge formation glycyltransferase FemA/FemB family protein, partial [Acidobacteriota bacterium]|nr:peptidoglycan bridge formation glycyltransferase FemA/FemB family protein [Acidobacteriota bacterium]
EIMKAKTRYNIGLAQRRGVRVSEDNSQQAFETYLRLTFETAKRQGFYAHDEAYHRQMWEELQPSGIAHLLTATWNENILVAWILFVFNGVLYYPYGASSNEHRNLMASNLMMWEAMRFGKRMTCQPFDLWGALGPQPDPKDPWFGFHRFKEGYGGNLIEFVGTYDLVLFPQLYSLVCFADDLRWKLLRFWARLR